jgi:hypothetical protein
MSYLGPELVVNGGFDTDSDWTKDPEWTISEALGIAYFSVVDTYGTIQQTVDTLKPTTTYQVVFTIVELNDVGDGGGVRPCVGGTIGILQTSVGTFTENITTGALNKTIGFQGFVYDPAGTMVIDNVSVREVLAEREVLADCGRGGISRLLLRDRIHVE